MKTLLSHFCVFLCLGLLLWHDALCHFQSYGPNSEKGEETGCSSYFSFGLHAGGSNFRLYGGSDLKTYLLMRW